MLPQPKAVEYHGSHVTLGPRALIATTASADEPAVSQLASHLSEWGVTEGEDPVQVVSPEGIRDTPFLFVVDTRDATPAVDEYLDELDATISWGDLGDEGYTLQIGRGADDQKTAVLSGSTWDGIYNAVQTLRQIVTAESNQHWVPTVSVDDYPAPYPYRGVIEGFYGPPWSHEQRLSIIDSLGDYKLNTYIYAPKDDPYHRAKWREPYPSDRKREIGELADAADRNHVEFMFSISPGVDIAYSSDEDFQALVAKTEEIRDVGADTFGLLLDDIVTELEGQDAERFDSPAEAQAYLINRYDDHLKSKDSGHWLYVVPTDYYQAGSTDYRETLANQVHDDVIMGWTGVGVTDPEITNEEAARVRDVFDHELLTWGLC
ncbi:beta-N-acetylglucosaminidase domain-containing protein [Halomicrobium urmianum]|uniref:beta-N-acetylglucosaminidase domain-containing protein n=1 Tax=Halomicrobium urmianum TaxID=1586233 RepID=UPI001CD9D1C0|nr:beta-N-acetylglucosaminidase domain-containing protein [Halomicrobium urmianum]